MSKWILCYQSKPSKVLSASIAWLESGGDGKGEGKMREMVEERNAGFGDDDVQSPLRFLKSAHSNPNFMRIL